MKHAFSLIELLIGIALAAMLLTFLYQSQRQNMATTKKIDLLRSQVHQRERFFLRLSSLFAHLQSIHYEAQDLTIYFWQEIDQDPHFCGVVKATLSVQKHKAILTIWPRQENGIPRQEILWDGLDSLSIHFFSHDHWQPHWNTQDKLPTKLKITVRDLSGTAIEFPYWIIK